MTIWDGARVRYGARLIAMGSWGCQHLAGAPSLGKSVERVRPRSGRYGDRDEHSRPHGHHGCPQLQNTQRAAGDGYESFPPPLSPSPPRECIQFDGLKSHRPHSSFGVE